MKERIHQSNSIIINLIMFLGLMVTLLTGCLERAEANTLTYSYDSRNRLTNVVYGNGSVISYTYDAAGEVATFTALAPKSMPRQDGAFLWWLRACRTASKRKPPEPQAGSMT